MEIRQDLQETYKNYYSEKENQWRNLGAKAKVTNIQSLVKDKTCAKLIEVGAGEGSILERISKTNISSALYALEISESGIERIKEKNIGKLVEAKLFDGYTIPYPDKFFDIAVCSHVIEHVEHPRLLLREIKRISKQQVFEVPIDFSFSVDKKAKHFLSYGHINVYTPALFRFLLISENFNIVKELNSMFPLEILFFGKNSPLKKAAVFTKWTLWNLITPLKKLKPNAYTVLTE